MKKMLSDRNRLVDLGPPRGLRFGGNGFAAMNTRGENAFHFMDKFDISFQFKTFASNGLLYMLKQSTVSLLFDLLTFP